MMIEASLHLRSFTKEDRNPQLYSAHSSPMNGSWREYYLISFFSDYSLASLSISFKHLRAIGFNSKRNTTIAS